MAARWVLDLRTGPTEPPVTPCCPAPTVTAAREVLGPGPVGWAAQVAREAELRVVELLPEMAGSTSIDTVRRPAEACILTILIALHADTPGEAVVTPQLALDGNRDSVHRGVALDRVLRAMWISHVHHYERLLEFLDKTLPPHELADTVRRVTELSFAYVEAFTARFSAEYTAEREAWLGSLAATRRQVIEDIIAGVPISVRDPERVLGVDLARHHRAAVLWTENDAGTDSAHALHQLAARLADAADTGRPLVVRPGGTSLWLWMSWAAPPEQRLAERLRDAVDAPHGIRAALGPLDAGIDGFRRSHLGALEVRRVAAASTRRSSWLADHDELEVIALLTANPEHARWFVHRQLGALATDDDRSAELRETLRLYLTFERSRTAAAQVLHVAPNTVGYRVRQAEAILGTDLAKDPLRIGLALEIYDYLNPEK
ncbi:MULTISPECIES: PucR family transcriptional regulator [Streptomyces]|uniref:PucR family transcriptional regulator n=1 Tax=Streptomyces TaxID=1883 RepID=UPI003332F0F6